MTDIDPVVARIVAGVRLLNKAKPFRAAMLPLFHLRRDGSEPLEQLNLLQLAVCTRGGTVFGGREGILEYLADLEADGYVPDLDNLSNALLSFGRRDKKTLELPEDDEEPARPEGEDDADEDENPLNL